MPKKGELFLIICIFLLLVICSNSPVMAQPGQSYLDYAQPEQVSQPNLFWELVKVVLALGFVLATAYLIFQFLSKKNPLLSRGQFINIIESSYLAPNRNISIVEAGSKFLILGVTEQNINLLAEINDQQVIALLRENMERQDRGKKEDSFADHLAGFLGKFNSLTSTKESNGNGNSDVQLHRLKDYFAKQIQEIKVFPVEGNSKRASKEQGKEKDDLQ